MPVMRPNKGKSFKCNQCSKEYKALGFLRRHQQYYCTATSTEEDHDPRPAQPTGKYYCTFCAKDYPTPKSFNLHYAKCLKNYDASQSKPSATLSPRRSTNGLKLYVCSVCHKGFSRLGTYKCHVSRHEEKKTIKSVILPVRSNSKELDSICPGITQPNASKLPRIPRLSERKKFNSDSKAPDAELTDNEVLPSEKSKTVDWEEPRDHTCSQQPKEEPLTDDVELPSKKNLEEPVERQLTVDVDHEGPRLVIQNVRHVERAESLALMPQVESIDLENICVSDEEPSTQAALEDDVMIVEEQPADRPTNASESSDQSPAVIEILEEAVASSITETVDEDVVIVKESTIDQSERVSITRKKTSTVTTINVQTTTSTINLLSNKPFSCTICERKFHTENTLKLHYDLHDRHKKVSPQKCCAHKQGDPRCCCQKRTSPDSSSRPKKSRLFECEICGFSREDQNKVIKHRMLFHRRNFTCTLCNRTFRTRLTRSMHMKMHNSAAE